MGVAPPYPRRRRPAALFTGFCLRRFMAALRPRPAEPLNLGADEPETQGADPVRRGVPVPVRRTQELPVGVPRTAASHAVPARGGARRAALVGYRPVRIFIVPVPTPLPHIAVHIVQAPLVRGKTSRRRRLPPVLPLRVPVVMNCKNVCSSSVMSFISCLLLARPAIGPITYFNPPSASWQETAGIMAADRTRDKMRSAIPNVRGAAAAFRRPAGGQRGDFPKSAVRAGNPPFPCS